MSSTAQDRTKVRIQVAGQVVMNATVRARNAVRRSPDRLIGVPLSCGPGQSENGECGIANHTLVMYSVVVNDSFII